MKRPYYLESQLLRDAGFRHAFFTRQGGVSVGPYESLNFSLAVGDEPRNVACNLARAAAALQVAPTRLYFLTQVHGREARLIQGDEDCEWVRQQPGDSVVSRRSDLACCVRVADCVPVLIADRRSGAAAAVHAGWRGVVAGVVPEAVAELGRQAGGELALVAAIGPHISRQAFEVSVEVASKLQAASSAQQVTLHPDGSRPHVDLGKIIRAQLRDAGVPHDAIDEVPGCTQGQPDLFFSFRRDGAHSGRHLAGIVPR
jgi:YfiH family protein